jgi:Pyruvate/2-oxoacid:ferredoxin oxidoreductase gamma subunit
MVPPLSSFLGTCSPHSVRVERSRGTFSHADVSRLRSTRTGWGGEGGFPISLYGIEKSCRPFRAAYKHPIHSKTCGEAALELELVLSGIGGQGIQLIGKALAQAAVGEGRHALVYGEYGGEMRGGKSLVNVVIGPERLKALPVVYSASHVIALHQKYWDEILTRVAPGALIFTDSSLRDQIIAPGRTVEAVPVYDLAKQAGNAQAAGFVMLAAFATATGIVRLDSLVGAMKQLVPSYRRQHVETNEAALRLGAAAVAPLSAPIALEAA